MAFQTGSQIRPELGNADYSGFANAASIQAQALANFGQQIGEGIEKYQKNKEITGVTLASIEGILASNPDLIALGQAEEGSIGKSFKQLQEDGTLNKRSAMEVKGYLDTIMESRAAQQKQEKANMTLKALNAVATGTMKPEEALAMGIPASEIKGAMDLTKTKPVTYSQVQGVSQLMQDQFGDVKVDESTGETYMQVPKTGDYIPFNTERVPANIPDAIKNMPGFEEWKKSKMSPSSSRDYSSIGMSIVD